MAEKSVLVAGDQTELVFPLVDVDTGDPITDAVEAKLHWRISSGATVVSNMTINGSEASYAFATNQLVKGTLKCRVRVRDSSNEWFSSREVYSIEVLDSL